MTHTVTHTVTHTRTHTRIRDPYIHGNSHSEFSELTKKFQNTRYYTSIDLSCLKRFPSKHTDRLQSPVPNSICPGWMLRAGPRAAARARTSGI
eukprot:COSAG02_NODE_5_length_66751_cov_63.939148_47_plen_93_part_00